MAKLGSQIDELESKKTSLSNNRSYTNAMSRTHQLGQEMLEQQKLYGMVGHETLRQFEQSSEIFADYKQQIQDADAQLKDLSEQEQAANQVAEERIETL